MALEEGPRDVHEGVKSLVRPTNDDEVVCKHYATNVDGVVQINAKARAVQVITEVIDKDAEE